MSNSQKRPINKINLIDPAASSNMPDPFLIIRRGDIDELRNLLQLGKINIHKTRWSGLTLLHRAAEIGHTDLCEFLVENGLNINERCTRGWHTPLHCALANGYIDTAAKLIAMGADSWKKNKSGDDPFRHGAKRGHKKICEEFRLKVLRQTMQQDLERNMSVMNPGTGNNHNEANASNG